MKLGADAAHDQPQRRAAPVTGADSHGLLRLQRQAGNRATAMLVQRATARETAAAKERADTDFAAGNTAPYFAGNFLANHIEAAQPEVQQAKGAKSVTSSKEARSQAYKKLQQRSNVGGGGTGWGAAQRMTGTNTLILDINGVQTRSLMQAVNVAQIDQLAARPPVRWFEFYSEDTVPAVTYNSEGKRTESKGKAHLGAQYDGTLNPDRYRIDHLSGVG